jgi:hypothetical protein
LATFCEMAYIFEYTIVFLPTNYREMAYKYSSALVKWPTFYREIAYIYPRNPQCFQGFAESQPLNYECLLTLQTGLWPVDGVFLSLLS